MCLMRNPIKESRTSSKNGQKKTEKKDEQKPAQATEAGNRSGKTIQHQNMQYVCIRVVGFFSASFHIDSTF